MIRGFAFAMTLFFPCEVVADSFCDRLDRFWQLGEAPQLGTGISATCGKAIVLGGGKSVHCAWEFDMRSPVAAQMFFETGLRLQDCGAELLNGQTSRVNHPDSYEQSEFALKDLKLSLALKDKGALGATFVFLRAQALVEK